MRSPKALHWWAWKKNKEEKENRTQNNENSNKISVNKLSHNFKINKQIGGAEECKKSFLNRVKYLPTIPLDDYSKVRTRLDDIYILPNGDKPTIESMERKE